MEVVAIAVVGVAAIVTAWALWRKRRLEELRRRVHEPGTSAVPAWDDRPPSEPSSHHPLSLDQTQVDSSLVNRSDVTDATSLATVSAVAFLWHWSTIDPQVVAALDFASRSDLDSSFDVARNLWDGLLTKEGLSQEKAFDRLLGYVGEQQLADDLVAAGHVVVRADSPTQQNWDLLVDGVNWDVKTVESLGDVNIKDPDVIYAVPEDAAGTLRDQMLQVDGFSHEASSLSLDEAIAKASGEAASDTLSGAIPAATVALVAWREVRAVHAGKSVIAAVEHGTVTSAVRGGAVLAGIEAGGLVGTLVAGPPGTAVGAALGALAAGVAASPVANHLKTRRLRSALTQLESELSRFGERCSKHEDRLRELASLPERQTREALDRLESAASEVLQSWRWRLAPTFAQVAILESVPMARERWNRARELSNATTEMLGRAFEDSHAELGATVLLAPRLALDLDELDENVIERVIGLRERVSKERGNLAVGKKSTKGEPSSDVEEEPGESPSA